jgi:intein/homing endonuclease
MNFNTDTNTVEWSEFTLYDKGVQDVYEITLDNGETVVCTASHKWYVRDQHDNVLVVTTDQLDEYNHILSPVV